MKRLLLCLAIACSATASSLAQAPLDRTVRPPVGKPPELRVPAWTRSTLTNGADLIVSEKHSLPLVSFSITFLGGASQFEPADRRGLASLSADMLSEGTTTRNGEALSNALQLLGTNVSARVASESGSVGFVSTTRNFEATLDILADMLLKPTFPAESLERLRAQRLVALNQAKAQPGAISSRVFPRIIYGDGHPYGRSPTEASINAITRDEVVRFHQEYFKPGRALVTVVGDILPTTARAALDRALAGWVSGGSKPAFTYPPVPALRATTIYLVDKPGSPQSTFALGLPGPPRDTPDYYSLQVMNTILGGMFQSRLNANLREDKGYSYGIRSSFGFGKGPGPFRTSGDVVADKSDASLVEFMKELRGIRTERPITPDELTTARDSLIQSLPGAFASVDSINGAISGLWVQGLPDDYYQRYAKAVASVTVADVSRVARTYIDLDHLAIVVVGDRATIEAPLKATNIAPIVTLNIDGNPE